MNENVEFITVCGSTAKKHGIDYLTGEACALSMRFLAEINESMLKRYIDYTGLRIPYNQVPKSNYNNRESYAVFLTWDIVKDLLIMELLESHECVIEVTDKDNGQLYLYCGNAEDIRARFKRFKHAYGWWDDDFKRHPGDCYIVGRSYSFGSGPRRGNSNIHAISGAAH